MNIKIHKYIIAFILVFMAQPIMAQDYLTVYFKNGNKERHLMSLVNEISTSKYDKAGVLHSDYVSQVVAMNDITYYYALDEIDSISFKKVSDEQIYQNFTSALSKINEVLDNCESVNDIKTYANEIASASGVEKVDVYDDAIVVRVKDCKDIMFYDVPKKEGTVSYSNARQVYQPLIDKKSKGYQINQSVRVAIADQNAKTEGLGYVESTECLHEIEDEFLKLGYDVDYIPQPGLDFFRKNMFDYDIIMLTTHGGYIDGKHWFASGLEIEEYDPSSGWNKDYLEDYYNKHNDFEDVKYLYIREVRNGENKWVLYNACSEDYIAKSPYHFENANTIIFTNVCHSLDKNNSVADMFFGKGASTYLGYEGSTYDGEYAGKLFFVYYMLNGVSTEYAFSHLPSYYINEPHGAVLKRIPRDENKDYFITKVVTAPSTEIESKKEKDGTYTATFYGYTTMRNYIQGFEMGFLFSTNADMVNAIYAPVNKNFEIYDSPNGNYRFSYTQSTTPETTIYYCAYTYDGQYYNYGDTCSLYIEKLVDLELSGDYFCMNVGDDAIVEITGNGSYNIYNDNYFAATFKRSGNKLRIEAVGVGTSTITVTDILTGQKASIEITVLEPSINICPDSNHPHMIDLGLPSGTKWACCNVGADKPEAYGYYYAWGETEPKDWYGWDTYSHCDGKKGTCHDIGEEISGTHYDVAYVKWQGMWQMPNSEQIKEIVNNCQYEVTTINDVDGLMVTGPNGNQMFLPFAGYMSGKTLYGLGKYGLFKSGSRCGDDLEESWLLNADADGLVRVGIWNSSGHTVRPVIKENQPTVPDLALESTSSVNIKVRQRYVINIISGSGSYTAKSNDEAVVKADADSYIDYLTGEHGDCVELLAIGVGESIVTVTDTKSGQQLSFLVTVSENVDLLKLSTYSLNLKVGETGDVVMLSSSGADFIVAVTDASVATFSIDNTTNTIKVIALGVGTCNVTIHDSDTGELAIVEVTVTSNEIPAEAVDLGLPSGTKWASYNIGATKPEEYGEYFAWGEIQMKEKYSWETYSYWHDDDADNWPDVNEMSIETIDIAGTKYDVASKRWGGSWRMPTEAQQKELMSKCTSEWVKENGVRGCRFTGPNGNSIFLPATGGYQSGASQDGTRLSEATYKGWFWSSTREKSDSTHAMVMLIAGNGNAIGKNEFSSGYPVRPVIP